MYLDHVPGKCTGTYHLVRNNSEIKTTMHWSLVNRKKMAAHVVAIDGTRLFDPASRELHHQASSSKQPVQLFSQSFQLLKWLQTPLWTAAIFFPNAPLQSNMDLVSDWLKYQICCRDMLHDHAHNDHGVSPKVQSLWHVPRSSTSWTPCDMLQGQILPKLLHKLHVAWVTKCQRTQEDVLLQNVPEKHVPTLRFGPCYMSLLHNPVTCPLRVYLTRFCPLYFLQQNVRPTCPLVWAHLKEDNWGEIINSVWLLSVNLV